MPRQLWIPEVLRDAGLTVYQEEGWEARGSASFDPIGVMWHHTATPPSWSSRKLTDLLVKGHSSLRGPLCHLQLNRDGVFVVIASGRANHAGRGSWPGIRYGNTQTIGIEAANTGTGEPWPEEQIEAYLRGTAAIIKYLNVSVDNVIGHKEWAPKRKIDPNGIDMDQIRKVVDQLILNPKKTNIIPDLPSGLNWGSGGLPNIPATQNKTIRLGSRGDDVKKAQSLLAEHGFNPGPADGIFGPKTRLSVIKFQKSKNLVPDGIVGRLTWSELNSLVNKKTQPPVSKKPDPRDNIKIHSSCKKIILKRRSKGNCVKSLQRGLNVLGHNAGAPDGVFGPKTESAVKSFQSSENILVDGIVGPQTWSKFD